ncbi:hypothetical protein PLUTE_b0559 [Pseudoalteromonas luteoviolacea DSM 6061]|nr:hypothetical protein [Pseudoalteromonas luteoviolacea DSM 6061]
MSRLFSTVVTKVALSTKVATKDGEYLHLVMSYLTEKTS